MPRSIARTLRPYWTTSDGDTIKLYHGDVIEVLRQLPSQSVHTVVTSPPYWGLRDYGTADWEGGDPDCERHKQVSAKVRPELTGGGFSSWSTRDVTKTAKSICLKCGARKIDRQIGSEKTPQEYVEKIVSVFREVRRVLRDDATCWVNLGDTYGGGKSGGGVFESGNLVGIPWRVALALQADGWILRQDIVWCLSGGTWVYVRSQKGDMPMMVRDLARLDPATVKLWNGDKWTRLLGMSWSSRSGEELEIVLRSGERISCTSHHKFPTSDGELLEANQLRIGQCLISCVLPEPESVKRPGHIGLDAAWLAGLYLAEGCGVDDGKIQIAGHAREVERWKRTRQIVESYGGFCTLAVNGNNQTIRVYGKVICAVIRDLVSGKDAKNKGFASVVWRYGNDFLESYMEGYLSGDGHHDPGNGRWRLGFTRNYNLERDLRTACARLGWMLTLNPTFAECNGQKFPSFRGEIRKDRSGHWNEKNRCEIVAIRKARCREVYDLGVEGEPHLFALTSGVLTHNSKPSPMPESVRNRCTKAHEYIFLLVKRMGYFYDAEAIKEKQSPSSALRVKYGFDSARDRRGMTGGDAMIGDQLVPPDGKANKRSVWTVASPGYDGAHFATYPPALITPPILAGTSEKGCCAECGAPWKRVVENEGPVGGHQHDRRGGADNPYNHEDQWGLAEGGAGANWIMKTVGWEPACSCDAEVVPCVVLDPFVGSGTTCCVAIAHGRRSIGIDLSEEYLRNNAIPRIEGELLKRQSTRHLIRRKVKAMDVGRTIS